MFTVKAHDKDYLKDPALREQYKAMVPAMVEKDFGPDAAQVEQMMVNMPYEQASQQFRQIHDGMSQQMEQIQASPNYQNDIKTNPAMAEQMTKMKQQMEGLTKIVAFFDYLEAYDNKPVDPNAMMIPNQPK